MLSKVTAGSDNIHVPMAGVGWSIEETRTLIILWEQANVKANWMRNWALYEKIALDIAEAGYDRAW